MKKNTYIEEDYSKKAIISGKSIYWIHNNELFTESLNYGSYVRDEKGKQKFVPYVYHRELTPELKEKLEMRRCLRYELWKFHNKERSNQDMLYRGKSLLNLQKRVIAGENVPDEYEVYFLFEEELAAINRYLMEVDNILKWPEEVTYPLVRSMGRIPHLE